MGVAAIGMTTDAPDDALATARFEACVTAMREFVLNDDCARAMLRGSEGPEVALFFGPRSKIEVRNGSATAEEGKVKNGMVHFGIGSPVTYVDSTGHARPALVTNCFGPLESNPSINVVVVNDDENQTDTYGRKIERFTSVVHESNQYAHGNYWKPVSE